MTPSPYTVWARRLLRESQAQQIQALTALLLAKEDEIARLQAENRDYIRALESRIQHLNSEIDRLRGNWKMKNKV